MITLRYSAAGICPHKTHAASHNCFSKPMFAWVFCAIYTAPYSKKILVIIVTLHNLIKDPKSLLLILGNLNITETDIFSWLPDSTKEFGEYLRISALSALTVLAAVSASAQVRIVHKGEMTGCFITGHAGGTAAERGD